MKYGVMLLLGMALVCGCGEHRHPPLQVVKERAPVVDSARDGSPFRYDEVKHVIYLDTRIAPPQRRQFAIPLGSVTLETLQVTDNKLTFRYTPEVEAGYTVYECTVPISSTPVEVQIKSDGTPGATSFDLARCKRIKSGNILLDKSR